MTTADQIISIINIKGPVLPVDIAKSIGTNILLASAHLSDLVCRKKLFLSKAKIGGSPVYYASSQKERLQQVLYPHLNEKDRRTFDLLKDKKVLRDSVQEPLIRVSLRILKDFAVPITVSHNNERILFWKWQSIDNSDAEIIIKERLMPKPEVKLQPEPASSPKPEFQSKPLPQQVPKPVEQKPVQEVKTEVQKPVQERIVPIEKPKPVIKTPKNPDDFLNILNNYFKEKKIKVLETNIIRKGSEIDYILKIPSAIGDLEYYCKTKNKKRLSDSDISAAFVQGQLKKLPTLIVMTGELNKKAQELLDSEFKGVYVEKIKNGN